MLAKGVANQSRNALVVNHASNAEMKQENVCMGRVREDWRKGIDMTLFALENEVKDGS